MENLIPVIGSEYCHPKPIKLTIDPEKGVTQINNKVIFQVEKSSFSLHSRWVLLDFSRNPVLNLSKKHSMLHERWQVFKGDSEHSNDLVFSVKRSSSKTSHKNSIDLEVFLAKNTKEHDWDYKVNAGSGKNSCDIYAQGSSTILAKMTINKGAFVGEVQPSVDVAFIVAVITIVDEMSSNFKAGSGVFNGTLKAVKGVKTVGAVGGLLATLGVPVIGIVNNKDDIGAAVNNGGTATDFDAAEDNIDNNGAVVSDGEVGGEVGDDGAAEDDDDGEAEDGEAEDGEAEDDDDDDI